VTHNWLFESYMYTKRNMCVSRTEKLQSLQSGYHRIVMEPTNSITSALFDIPRLFQQERGRKSVGAFLTIRKDGSKFDTENV
jgi:hypothetical protein